MADVNEDDDELWELRRRAYARDSDIHLDPVSLNRLRELEEARAEPEPGPEPDPADEALDAEEPAEERPQDEDEAPRPTPRAILWLIGLARRTGPWVMGLRRSTILIAIGVVLAVATLATVLTLVQRVQTDPLQLGATQVARLSVDTGYEIPLVFNPTGGGLEDAAPAQAYQSFHGLRVLMNSAIAMVPTGRFATCMTVYPEANVTTTSDSFEGPVFAGCEAGQFPAIVQFTLDTDGLPAELHSAFPGSSGLQFVYDADHDEVVIFSDR